MDLGIFLMNRDAVKYAKSNYIKRHIYEDQSTFNFDKKVNKYKQEAINKYGKYNELWDGKSNKDIGQAAINLLRKRYWVNDEDYKFFYAQDEYSRKMMIKVMLYGGIGN